MDKYRTVFKIEINISGMGGGVGYYSDRLKRDLESLGYAVKSDDPEMNNDSWRLTDATRMAFDASFKHDTLPVIDIKTEHCPWGG